MPRGDRTGPAGMGPMTGRAAGYCAGYPMPGFINPVGGRGFWGWGRGAWARAGFGYPIMGGFAGPNVPYSAQGVTAEQELQGLKQQAEYFENALDEIKKRIEQLEVESKK